MRVCQFGNASVPSAYLMAHTSVRTVKSVLSIPACLSSARPASHAQRLNSPPLAPIPSLYFIHIQ
ncbi:hypothetical protein T492DRAFT_1014588 [Pavlovales sp. CCMP2436]|nr:hypothetical protein T492DRAFT_1014588 [Pavlovales sp. CCMP2436]